ncbi:hypothetical protein F4803DRAFT_548630 [Xylaria telfairii]|nr:hypothetical protein F4803DRAFT_548630 [Xylaria telfairii]
MGTDETKTWTSSPLCPHSEGIGAPVCWDCAEGGHVHTPLQREEGGTSPSWQRLKRIRRSLGFGDQSYYKSNTSPTGTQVSMLEVRPPEDGLEVGSPLSRRSQPGLILVTGPRVVSPEEKFIRPEPKSWDSEPPQKLDIVSEPGVTPEPTKKGGKWGLQRKTFQIVIVVAILTFAGVIIGIAVAVTQQNKAHSTSTSAGGHVSSSSSPMTSIIATETVSYYVADDSSIPVTLSETDKPSSSRQVGSVMTLTGTPTTATGQGGDKHPESTIIAITSTAYVTAQLPPPTNKNPPQPVTTVIVAPPPATSVKPPAPSASSPSSRICIGNDGSTYTDPGTKDKFRIECATAHQGKDIENLEASSMQECIGLCTKNKFCKGVIWFNVGPQGTNLNYCWLKSAMDGEVQSMPDAQSAMLL